MLATGAHTGYSKVRLHIGSYLFLLPSQQRGIAAWTPVIIVTAAQSPFALAPTTAGGS